MTTYKKTAARKAEEKSSKFTIKQAQQWSNVKAADKLFKPLSDPVARRALTAAYLMELPVCFTQHARPHPLIDQYKFTREGHKLARDLVTAYSL